MRCARAVVGGRRNQVSYPPPRGPGTEQCNRESPGLKRPRERKGKYKRVPRGMTYSRIPAPLPTEWPGIYALACVLGLDRTLPPSAPQHRRTRPLGQGPEVKHNSLTSVDKHFSCHCAGPRPMPRGGGGGGPPQQDPPARALDGRPLAGIARDASRTDAPGLSVRSEEDRRPLRGDGRLSPGPRHSPSRPPGAQRRPLVRLLLTALLGAPFLRPLPADSSKKKTRQCLRCLAMRY